MIIKLECGDSYIVGDAKISRMEVHPISFVAFAELASNVQRATQGDDMAYAKRLFRSRIKAQVKAFNGASAVALDDILIGKMPVRLAMQVRNAITDANVDASDDVPKVLSQGDGVSAPIHIKLGRPINVGDGKTPLAELEIVARDLDQLEDAILAENKLEQVSAVLKIAKPVSTDVKLLSLPSWALDQISLQDGLWMMSAVLPRFFGEAESS